MKEKEFIQKGFDQIAYRYNFFNSIITFNKHKKIKQNLAKKVICNITDKNKGLILDICCGTGDIAFFLEKYASKEQKIIGLDFSKKMLEIAKKRESRVEFIQKDVVPLDYPDNSISAITVGFGLRNLIDLNFGLQEIYRVLKKGGVFCALDMGKITFPVAKQLFHLFFFYFVPKIGAILVPKSKMFSYFPESTKNYPDPKQLKQKLEKIGFQVLECQTHFLGACVTHFAKK